MIVLSDREVSALAATFPWFASLAPGFPQIIASPGRDLANALVFVDSMKLRGRKMPDPGPRAVLVTDDALVEVAARKICVPSPWVEFARASRVIAEQRNHMAYRPTEGGAWIADGAKIAESVRLEPGAVVGAGCEIGEECWIGAGANIRGGVRLGRNCRIQAGAVVGADGFGYGFPAGRAAIVIAHLGGLRIEDNVDIGPGAVVCCGTLDPTIVGEGTKIDGLAYIGHNVSIGSRTMVSAGAVVGGSARVGSRVWIHAGAQIKGKGQVADNAIVGLGAVVMKPVGQGITVMGDPAGELRSRLRREATLDRLVNKAREGHDRY